MRRKFAMVCALLMTTLWVGVPTVSAYARNASPVLVSASCNAADDTVYVSWSKDAGKPAIVWYSTSSGGGEVAIPGSRGSKGDWTMDINQLGRYFSPGENVSVKLYDKGKANVSNQTTATCS